MVKRTSCLASNEKFRVRILVELLTVNGECRHSSFKNGVRSVAVTARLPVKQEVRVQLPSDTLCRQECASGKQAASKTAQQGSIPCTPADRRRGSTEKGAALVKRIILVRIQSSALDISMRKRPNIQRKVACSLRIALSSLRV